MWHLETLYIFRKWTVLQQFILCLNADTMALDSLKPGKTFSSWEEVEKFMNELESVNFSPLRFDDTKIIASYNKAVS